MTICDRLSLHITQLFTHPPNAPLSSWPMVELPIYLLISSLEIPQEFQLPPQVLQVIMPIQHYRDCVLLFTWLHITAGVQQKHYYDCWMKHKAYEPGDLVWIDLPALSRQKLSPKWAGPFRVLTRFDSSTNDIGVNYEVLDQQGPEVSRRSFTTIT